MFVEAGYDTHLLSWDRRREAPRRETKDGYSIHRCHLPSPYSSRWLFLTMPFWALYEFFFLLTHRADRLHVCDFDTLPPALLVRFLKGTRLVYDVYDFYSVKSATLPRCLRGLVRNAEQLCARTCDAVVIADAARTYLLGPRPVKRLSVAMNCPYDDVDAEWTKPADGPLSIFYGGLVAPCRGIEKLVEIARHIEGVRVVIAGWITDNRFRRLLADAPHVEYIGTVPYRDALKRTFEAHAVYCYYDPSLEINRTANSSKMFDAFMCSTAVLANSEPPAARVVQEHECGSLLPFDDDQGLRKTLIAWRDNPEWARQLGRNGRALFEREFSWPVMAERILEVHRETGVATR